MLMMLVSFCLAPLQYLPQLLSTYKKGEAESLSGIMVAVQCPLFIVWATDMWHRYDRENYGWMMLVWGKVVVWGCQSGALAWVCWRVSKTGRDEDGGTEGWGLRLERGRKGLMKKRHCCLVLIVEILNILHKSYVD
jgi:hypothetical protein